MIFSGRQEAGCPQKNTVNAKGGSSGWGKGLAAHITLGDGLAARITLLYLVVDPAG